MTRTHLGLSVSIALISIASSVTPALAAYRGISHDAPGYDSSGYYHSARIYRQRSMSVCTDYDEQGRCLRTQVYRNTYEYAKDFPRTAKKTYQRMDHTYVDQSGERHYDPRHYKVYNCGTQFRPESCWDSFDDRKNCY